MHWMEGQQHPPANYIMMVYRNIPCLYGINPIPVPEKKNIDTIHPHILPIPCKVKAQYGAPSTKLPHIDENKQSCLERHAFFWVSQDAAFFCSGPSTSLPLCCAKIMYQWEFLLVQPRLWSPKEVTCVIDKSLVLSHTSVRKQSSHLLEALQGLLLAPRDQRCSFQAVLLLIAWPQFLPNQ